MQRLVTGSSDGLVKVWNPCNSPEDALVGVIAELPGGVSSGTFSPDYTKLLIGDASGSVHLLSANRAQLHEDDLRLELEDSKNPKEDLPIIISQIAPPPDITSTTEPETSALEISRLYIERNQLIRHRHPLFGVFQGPEYFETGLRREDENREDMMRLRADARTRQIKLDTALLVITQPVIEDVVIGPLNYCQHKNNMLTDSNLDGLLLDTEDFHSDMQTCSENVYNTELIPRDSIFVTRKNIQDDEEEEEEKEEESKNRGEIREEKRNKEEEEEEEEGGEEKDGRKMTAWGKL